jgi:hypothetical protein
VVCFLETTKPMASEIKEKWKGWARVHLRIKVYLDQRSDWFYVKLFGPKKKELLRLNVSFNSADAHKTFYRDFLRYLRDNVYLVDRSSTRQCQNHSTSVRFSSLSLSGTLLHSPTPLIPYAQISLQSERFRNLTERGILLTFTGISNYVLDCLQESLIALVACCKTTPSELPKDVVEELFEDVDAELADLDREKRELDAELADLDGEKRELDAKRKKMASELERLESELMEIKRRRVQMYGNFFYGDLSEVEGDDSDDSNE